MAIINLILVLIILLTIENYYSYKSKKAETILSENLFNSKYTYMNQKEIETFLVYGCTKKELTGVIKHGNKL